MAVVVAAGRGERFGSELPKQYAALAGRPVLRHTVERLIEHPEIDGVRCVIDPAHRDLYDAAVGDLPALPPVTGGATRQASVHAGLESLIEFAPEFVLVHDAARPCVSAELIDRLVGGLQQWPAVLPAVPVVDSLRRVEAGAVIGQVERDGLVRAQTPQAFRFEAILDAHRRHAGGNFTDDVAVAAACGLSVGWVAGDAANVKLTLPEDHTLAQSFLSPPSLRWRTGLGFDIHALAPHRPLWLCGVKIPFELGLAGHSDADVALHAITDALLGTIGAGDIGTHFPPSDQRWKGVESSVFVRHAVGLVAARGGRLENVDLAMMCERPKIGVHREAMTARLCELLHLQADQVSIKATTMEKLGAIGRGEGIAAQAVVSVAFPA
ncbi:MAG: bifunctional 2-C-methyl-D-erythritol 4-phosphate cytidylyltransferase/2-C-methyl-D-erythritol 2,4-cyclodiphosphate synthase [Geminicoccaceae bacterium]